MLKIFSTTFLARGIAAFGDLILIVLLGRFYGAEGVGLFTIGQIICLGAAILARYGMDNAVIRFVGQDPESAHTKLYLTIALKKALFLSVICAFIIFLFKFNIATMLNNYNVANILIPISISIPAFTFCFILSGFFKGISKPALACFYESGAISLVCSLLLIFAKLLGFELNVVLAGWFFALSAWLVMLKALYDAGHWFKDSEFDTSGGEANVKGFRASSNSFFILSLSQFIQKVLVFIIAGLLLSTEDLGILRTAERTALLISFILVVINAIFPPKFARAYYSKSFHDLKIHAQRSSLIGGVLATPMLVICLIYPGWVLSIFGNGFERAESILIIIAIAQFVNVISGSVGFLLNMTDNEVIMKNIALLSSGFGVIALLVLVAFYGVIGAAVSLSISLILQNIVAFYFVWKKLSISMIPLTLTEFKDSSGVK